MSLYSIMVVGCSKGQPSLRCLVGFNERTTTAG